MYVLEKLWKGRVRPSERSYRADSRYAELISKGLEAENRFYAELSDLGKQAYKENYDIQVEMIEIGEQDAYLRGVRFGAQFMLDIIGEYHSQLPQVGGQE